MPKTISFTGLPKTTRLFLDFLSKEKQLENFYPRRLPHEIKIAHREKLVSILTKQNKMLGANAPALANIENLKNPRTLAIVTGQQMGIFSGPLYTIYKALATIRLSERYKTLFPEFDFVPIFWLENEDHDFEEIRSFTVFSIENELKKIAYEQSFTNPSKTPIRHLSLSDDIARVLEELQSTLQKTDFFDEIFEALRSCYCTHEPISMAFGKLLARWLSPFGLILMDPSDHEFKKLALPVFKSALEHSEELHKGFSEQTEKLKSAGYHAQVETDPTWLFLKDLDPKKMSWNSKSVDKIRISSEDWRVHQSEILSILDASPERFIPNVILRPIVQDFLLPTFAYVGGPGEIAYFAQFMPVYDFFKIPMPNIVARPFVTLLEKKIGKIPEKYGLPVECFLQNTDSLLQNVSPIESSEKDFKGFSEKALGEFQILSSRLGKIDNSLQGASETAWGKIEQALKTLQTKATEAEKRNAQLANAQLLKAANHLYPFDNFQEREINVIYYLNKYGLPFFEILLSQIDFDSHEHQIVEL